MPALKKKDGDYEEIIGAQEELTEDHDEILKRLERLEKQGETKIKNELSIVENFLLLLFAATGVIFFWRGIWEMTYDIAYLKEPWVTLVIGVVILAITGAYKELA